MNQYKRIRLKEDKYAYSKFIQAFNLRVVGLLILKHGDYNAIKLKTEIVTVTDSPASTLLTSY